MRIIISIEFSRIIVLLLLLLTIRWIIPSVVPVIGLREPTRGTATVWMIGLGWKMLWLVIIVGIVRVVMIKLVSLIALNVLRAPAIVDVGRSTSHGSALCALEGNVLLSILFKLGENLP